MKTKDLSKESNKSLEESDFVKGTQLLLIHKEKTYPVTFLKVKGLFVCTYYAVINLLSLYCNCMSVTIFTWLNKAATINHLCKITMHSHYSRVAFIAM